MWGAGLGEGYCRVQCYDSTMIQRHQFVDSTAGYIYESIGKYEIRGFGVYEDIYGANNEGGWYQDAIHGVTGYMRVGEKIHDVDKSYQAANAHDHVSKERHICNRTTKWKQRYAKTVNVENAQTKFMD